MALPSPLPDNPLRWEGWRTYNSESPYDRLCLDFDSNPSPDQIEDHCRRLLIWWQKKLPLKNQPSNPMSQLLRAGIDEAPQYLAEARTILLDGGRRAEVDKLIRERLAKQALDEVGKFFAFAVSGGVLTKEDEGNLIRMACASGLPDDVIASFIDEELAKSNAVRKLPEPEPSPRETQAAAPPGASLTDGDASDQFRRILRISGLDDDGMTDDQRDAFCNIGENLGLTGGQAEDLIDEYLEEMENRLLPNTPKTPGRGVPSAPVKGRFLVSAAKAPTPKPAMLPGEAFSPLNRAQERARHPNFSNSSGMEFLLVPSGIFNMGSAAPDAAPNEQPVSRTAVTCYYLARFPVTNAIYELFDPSHRNKRLGKAANDHPVVQVSYLDAVKFCDWLSARDRRKYRLPTEAEWEYAARGIDGRIFPWGDNLNSGEYANFADANTAFIWRCVEIDDGYAETSPVGAYPKGVGPFGIEDLSGNVWEWCSDTYGPYSGKDGFNPKRVGEMGKKVYRGGSWKSRGTSLRTSARGHNLPGFAANDVGFRLVCECA
jgi:formylglycine-generating enzyme required for sulfatase activity